MATLARLFEISKPAGCPNSGYGPARPETDPRRDDTPNGGRKPLACGRRTP
jgi:hypothetical protein